MRRLVSQEFSASLAGCMALAGLVLGCASISKPRVPVAGSASPERPLIVVPGILGSKLVHEDSGKFAWGAGLDVFFPRDRAYELANPIPPGAEGTDALVPAGVVDVVKLGPYEKKVYRLLTNDFEARGYQLGRLSDPQPGDTLFLFDYDFRRSNLEAVAKLRSELDHLRRSRGLKELPFDLLCQSNGGYICRHLVRYGAEFDPTYPDRSSPSVGPPRGLVPRRIALAGTANAGALRILREFRDGRYFVKRVGRWFSPEILFAMRPLFDDLPWALVDEGDSQPSVFLNERGEPMDVDLYSAEDWVRYGLGVFSERAQRRLSRPRAVGLFGTKDEQVKYLSSRLSESRHLQSRLISDEGLDDASVGDLDPVLFMVQGQKTDSPHRAVLLEREGRWHTVFAGDLLARTLTSEVRAKLVADGDGHATLDSQEALSPLERSWLVPETVYVDGTHFNLILNPQALDALSRFFLSDVRMSP